MKDWLTKIHFFERYIGFVLFLAMIFFYAFAVVRFFFISPGRINGPSMEPAFIDEDFFLVNKLVYLFSLPERYDVVQVIDPQNQKLMVKRIIGLPGEVVIVKRGKIYVKSKTDVTFELNEPYLKQDVYTLAHKFQRAPEEYIVNPGNYFVVGDNRAHSTDSRVYGSISRSNIVGKILTNSKNNK
ncbi:MAG: signal peptidase I [Candidatus Magasanikbacteria bacterium RIFCSPLOWO2_01_FULL_40_15]|uniref:Signal peptidase I n=1 Tax=Candidatus Magasanikbacteria bacterium RIFCSPLOWO2_01_FULL_40_15 TaxID=1798686 RepID=A0A1F6N0F6_9BACT|nr:MAG: signal peptidase I [Candidatus Magasanikbacteria bacterium RIFCSPLOWO2_01_FULL_40_15]